LEDKGLGTSVALNLTGVKAHIQKHFAMSEVAVDRYEPCCYTFWARTSSAACRLAILLGFSLKIKLTVPLLCICALPGKAVIEVNYAMLSRTLNPTHSLTKGALHQRRS